MKRRAILMHAADDVATALEPLSAGDSVAAGRGERQVEVTLCRDVPFGHKFALRDIDAGQDVLKYGLPIGRALQAIGAGDWVHVHNCRSDRFGHRHQKYGVNA